MDEIDAEIMGDFADLEIEETRIALYHGTDFPITEALESCGNFDAVISGHTHQKKVEMVGETLFINPGTAHGFGEEATIALLNTNAMEVEFIRLS